MDYSSRLCAILGTQLMELSSSYNVFTPCWGMARSCVERTLKPLWWVHVDVVGPGSVWTGFEGIQCWSTDHRIRQQVPGVRHSLNILTSEEKATSTCRDVYRCTYLMYKAEMLCVWYLLWRDANRCRYLQYLWDSPGRMARGIPLTCSVPEV